MSVVLEAAASTCVCFCFTQARAARNAHTRPAEVVKLDERSLPVVFCMASLPLGVLPEVDEAKRDAVVSDGAVSVEVVVGGSCSVVLEVLSAAAKVGITLEKE